MVLHVQTDERGSANWRRSRVNQVTMTTARDF
jgi:hypothetical protein